MAKQPITTTCTYVETGMPAQRLQNLSNEIHVDEVNNLNNSNTAQGKMFRASRRLGCINEFRDSGYWDGPDNFVADGLEFRICTENQTLPFAGPAQPNGAGTPGYMLRVAVSREETTPDVTLNITQEAAKIEFSISKGYEFEPLWESNCAFSKKYILFGGAGLVADVDLDSIAIGGTWFNAVTGITRSPNPMDCEEPLPDANPTYDADCQALLNRYQGYAWRNWRVFTNISRISQNTYNVTYGVRQYRPPGSVTRGTCTIFDGAFSCFESNTAGASGGCGPAPPVAWAVVVGQAWASLIAPDNFEDFIDDQCLYDGYEVIYGDGRECTPAP